MPIKFLLPAVTLVLSLSCNSNSKSGSDSSDEPGAETGEKPDETLEGTTAGTLKIATAVQDLQISQSLAVQVPSSVKGEGEELNSTQAGEVNISAALLARKKTFEACEVRSNLFSTLFEMYEAASKVCIAEKLTQIEFGKKYALEVGSPADSEGEAFSQVRIWVDDSKKAEELVRFHMCFDDRLVYTVDLTGTSKQGAKGNFFFTIGTKDGPDGIAKISGSYDNNFTSDGKTTVSVKRTHDRTNDGTHSITLGRIVANLSQTGSSKIGFSRHFTDIKQGSNEAFKGQAAGAARIDEKLGAAVFLERDLGNDNAASKRSFFDGAGYRLEQSDNQAFQPGGALFVTEQDVPPLISETFVADPTLAPWDCKADITIGKDQIDDAVISSCNDQIDANFPDEDCNGDSFEKGLEDSNFDVTKLPAN